MTKLFVLVVISTAAILPQTLAQEPKISEASQECIDCHASLHPGIVADWKASRHSRVTPAEGMLVKKNARRISAKSVPDELKDVVVGCAECHKLRGDKHADTFDHLEHKIHVVVSPADCAVCHPVERDEFEQNIMSRAYTNLAHNAVYNVLENALIGDIQNKNGKLHYGAASDLTKETGCYHCHGTKLEFKGMETRDHDLIGEAEFPVIKGWPNQGVGRINLDGSVGACSACHTRHDFSIEMARKPHTCRECHVGPDVPAYKVYMASKHGNIYAAKGSSWNYTNVPWTVGADFSAPTCATCHMSLLANTDGEIVAERTHRMNDRLPWRIFGLPYAHPHPVSPDTTIIKNSDGLQLPTDFAGNFAKDFLIGPEERAERAAEMQKVCSACHDSSWTKGFWKRFEHEIEKTNEKTAVATEILLRAWNLGIADKANPFDEPIERKWMDVWLFHANSVRFSAAMGGGGDYSVFADGYYQMHQKIAELHKEVETEASKAQVSTEEEKK